MPEEPEKPDTKAIIQERMIAELKKQVEHYKMKEKPPPVPVKAPVRVKPPLPVKPQVVSSAPHEEGPSTKKKAGGWTEEEWNT